MLVVMIKREMKAKRWCDKCSDHRSRANVNHI